MASGYVCASPHSCCIGTGAQFSTKLRLHTLSGPHLYAIDILCTMAPLAPITPTTINCDRK